MRIVLDTNIYISSFIFGGNARIAFDYSFSDHQVFISDFIIDEIKRVLKDKFQLDQIKLEKVIRTLLLQANEINPTGDIPDVGRDKDDNNILWLAQQCRADMIITGDKDLLSIMDFEGIRIIHPSEFIKSTNN